MTAVAVPVDFVYLCVLYVLMIWVVVTNPSDVPLSTVGIQVSAIHTRTLTITNYLVQM